MEHTKDWSSYSSLEQQYRNSSRSMKRAADNIRSSGRVDADIDMKIVNEMAEDTGVIADELHRKILYSYNMLTEDERSLFTGRQREVLELRQKYKPSVVAKMLGITPETVFDIYKAAIERLESYNKHGKQRLTLQQNHIMELMEQGIKYRTIAKLLNTTESNVKKQVCLAKKVTKNA